MWQWEHNFKQTRLGAVKDRIALKSTLTVRDLVQIDETKGGVDAQFSQRG